MRDTPTIKWFKDFYYRMRQETENAVEADIESRTETQSQDDIFSVLSSEYSVEELDIREHPNGVVLAQSPDGKTVEVKREFGELVAEEVSSHDVDFESQDEVEDVFGESVMAE